jgi:aconitate hydratase A / 2-methylisocitrate dehydratase
MYELKFNHHRRSPMNKNTARKNLTVNGKTFTMHNINTLFDTPADLDRLPFSIRVLLEAALRRCDDEIITMDDVQALAAWQPQANERQPVAFYPGRVIMQDFTGVPAVVDLAAMRSAMARLGGDPSKINPEVPVDLIIDHSVQVDAAGRPDAIRINTVKEFERNQERYTFLRWGQQAFDNLRVIPPSTGIIHQVNLEYLTQGVLTKEQNGETVVFPDTLVGTDSHTTMINGAGVVGFGVGGIEALAVMLGQPLSIVTPKVIGFRLTGSLPEGTTPTDLTLTIVQMLRKVGVVGKFVEFFGTGLSALSLADRAMVSNMTPETGATVSFFPFDQQTADYLRLTGRDEGSVALAETYFKAQGLFRRDNSPDPQFTQVIELDLSTIQPSLAGPRRPQDRILMKDMKTAFESTLKQPKSEGGFEATADNGSGKLTHGSLVIAAITSCTNTSNPYVMVAAGLVARKAVEKGLHVPKTIKTSLAPGSRVVTEYLKAAGLLTDLEQLGFHVVGYGCTTCIGNSGPLDGAIVQEIKDKDLVATSVLSGNRNFEGRVSPWTQANYLASPPLVVAYALAGKVNIDLSKEPLGQNGEGKDVYLKDIWPTSAEIQEVIERNITPALFQDTYADVFNNSPEWNAIAGSDSELYAWDADSTYIQEPPYFEGLKPEVSTSANILGARALAVLGDSITTDHISPAGAIPPESAAADYLREHGVASADFNSLGSRRGNDRVMARGTFGNIRLKNQLVPGVEGSYTSHLPNDSQMRIFDAAMQYKKENVPLIIMAGKEYGTGSSRDWAAKGPLLLGVKAVIAESFERIHRSNLIGMGILPLQFLPGENAASLELTGRETFNILGLEGEMSPGMQLTVQAVNDDGKINEFAVIARMDTPIEVEYSLNGGILHHRLRSLL